MTGRRALPLLAIAAAVACCSSPDGPAAPVEASSPPSATVRSTSNTPLPGSAESPAPTGTPSTRTDTEWGRIWDGLPASFPRFPGAQPTETGDGPASAVLDVPGDVATVTEWYQSALEHAGYSTLSLSGPLEDGSMEIDSMGPILECLVRTTIAPLGGETIVTILYGADCPAG
ncbi:MAG TPA: hypothetical protein VH723_10785 [Candidatus Limnocylindrales bacterium]